MNSSRSIPQISVSPPPPNEPVIEPHSPFANIVYPPNDESSFRPRHLTPPPVSLQRISRVCNSSNNPVTPNDELNEGLDHERFQDLLQASRERNAGKRELDLRREITLRAHREKQRERRAIFLSKILEPPSPRATETPKTPPESPALFHFSLPSPGLTSPSAVYDEDILCDILGMHARKPWVEQIDFRQLNVEAKPKPDRVLQQSKKYGKLTPSLDEISARMTAQGYVCVPPSRQKTQCHVATSSGHSRLPASVGRLQTPIPRPIPSRNPEIPNVFVSPLPNNNLRTTNSVSCTVKNSHTELNNLNLQALDIQATRARKAYDMLSALKRRTNCNEFISTEFQLGVVDRKCKWKRRSAPGDLSPLRERTGFEHPVLSMPGGF